MTWARATLRRGTSGGSVWQVDSNYPQARVVVGCAPSAGWVVTGPGIANFHVELYWDGNVLYIADPQAAGDVRLNGQPVRGWTQVQGRAQLVFGHAIMELETEVKEVSLMVRDPTAAPRISLVGDSTMIQPPSASELDDERTRVAESYDEIAPSKVQITGRPPAPPGRAPAVSAPPSPPRAPGRPAPPPAPSAPMGGGGAERPRLGGAPPAAFRQEAKTLVGEELQPIGQEATRMVDSDQLLGGQPPILGAAPSFGAPQAPAFGAQQAPAFGAPQSPGFGGPGAAGVMVETSPGMANPPTGGPMGGAGGAPIPPGTGGFAPPPAFAATQQMNAQSGGKLPARTWLMIALFVAVVFAWLSMPTPEEEAAATRPITTAAPVIPPGTDAGVDAGARQFVNPSAFVPVLTTELLDGGLSRTPDSVAAQLVADGHLEDALVQYEALYQAHPERPEYAVMCEVVRRQLMNRCTNGMRWDGTPCVSN